MLKNRFKLGMSSLSEIEHNLKYFNIVVVGVQYKPNLNTIKLSVNLN